MAKRGSAQGVQALELEVDFVVGDVMAIEVKGSGVVTDRHLAGLRALAGRDPAEDGIGILSMGM